MRDLLNLILFMLFGTAEHRRDTLKFTLLVSPVVFILVHLPLRLALQNLRSASFVVPPGASTGPAALRVLHDGVLLLDAMVEVR